MVAVPPCRQRAGCAWPPGLCQGHQRCPFPWCRCWGWQVTQGLHRWRANPLTVTHGCGRADGTWARTGPQGGRAHPSPATLVPCWVPIPGHPPGTARPFPAAPFSSLCSAIFVFLVGALLGSLCSRSSPSPEGCGTAEPALGKSPLPCHRSPGRGTRSPFGGWSHPACQGSEAIVIFGTRLKKPTGDRWEPWFCLRPRRCHSVSGRAGPCGDKDGDKDGDRTRAPGPVFPLQPN